MRTLFDRTGWALAGALAFALLMMAARAIHAGPLDPPGPVASTMKTLGDVPPSWHQLLSGTDGSDSCNSSRFTCVMSNAAVLDHETGLVWQKLPIGTSSDWDTVRFDCDVAVTGGRRGWRLPSPDELASLSTPGSGLPPGNPFSISLGFYWSSAPSPTDPAYIVTVNPTTTAIPPRSVAARGDTSINEWCVRGDAAGGTDAAFPFPQVWHPDLLDVETRFGFLNQVIVDHETGLEWQKTPATTTSTWVTAFETCARFRVPTTGLGWRLPSLAELLSLYTDSGTGTLPADNPFTNTSGVFWTSTADASTTANAYTVDTTQVTTSTVLAKTSQLTGRHWCVRGGAG
jgi:hypothetical protein